MTFKIVLFIRFPHDPPRGLGVEAGEPEVDGVAVGAGAHGEVAVVASRSVSVRSSIPGILIPGISI